MVSKPDLRRLRLPAGELITYVVAVLIVLGLIGVLSGLSPAARDLVDSDGYMRFLRVSQLANGGDWFNPVLDRSNYPYGETSHWTRPLDVYVLSLSWLLRPVLGTESLYWAALVNAPLLLIALGAVTYWAVGRLCHPTIRSVLMPALLGLPLVVAYFGFGRVDHHGPILLIFMWVLGLQLRLLRQPLPRTAVLLGVALGVGIWVSVEFLVPWGLVAASFGALAMRSGKSEPAATGAAVFAVTALTSLVVSLIERGSFVIGYDRISLVHSVLAAATCLVFLGVIVILRSRLSGVGRFLGATVVVVAGGTLLALVFPDLLGGPFVGTDPVVRQRWLSGVVELLPISRSEGPALILFRIGPILLGFIAWLLAYPRKSEVDRESVHLLFGWLGVYAVLTLAQFRWALFSHGLALLLLLVAVGPLYDRLGRLRLSPLLRPMAVALLLGLPLLGAGWSDAAISPSGGTPDCALEDALPALSGRPPTTVLADADVGPEIMYRTRHRVIATPYHGNASALHYLFNTMAATDHDVVRRRLADRSVGLILVCSTRPDLMRPLETGASFYDALVTGPPPDFLRAVPLAGSTDLLLYQVEL